MIISHKYKYIFIKPMKVAGTSVQVALGQNCDANDIYVGDTHGYAGLANTTEGFYENKNGKVPNIITEYDMREHFKPDEIKKAIGNKIWNDYCKVTIIRNPWDMCISRFWYAPPPQRCPRLRTERVLWLQENFENREGVNKRFREAIMENPKMNKIYYFNKNKPIANVYLKFENLQNDFNNFSDKLGIPQVRNFPHKKSQFRLDKRHYSTYYDDETRDLIAKEYKYYIKYFGYKFENKKL